MSAIKRNRCPDSSVFSVRFQAYSLSGFLRFRCPVSSEICTQPITCGSPPSPKSIRVTDPIAGDEWDTDKDHTINWETENISKSDYLWIGYSLDDGSSWHTLDNRSVNDGSKKWVMEDDRNLCHDTDKARVKIYLIEHPEVSATTGRFKIDHKKGHPDC